MNDTIPAVVLGATGYVGGELLRLISGHPNFDLIAAVSQSRNAESIAAVFPHLARTCSGKRFAAPDEWPELLRDDSKLALFSAAPHGASAAMIAAALAVADGKNINTHVVDCSADFRYADQASYEAVYGVSHGAPDLLSHFRCGVPEHIADSTAQHIGHPGCFATAVLLAIVPLLQSGLTDSELFVTAITGSTGSGRSPQSGTHHPERHNNLYAYKPLEHRHAPEITRLAAAATGYEARLHFIPHSGPFARGIHVTVQAKTNSAVSTKELRACFDAAYDEAPFVEIVDGMPRMKNVVASNTCQIGCATSDDVVVITAVLDNLVKGAAGGAVQWMNRLWRLPETAGLGAAAPAWI